MKKQPITYSDLICSECGTIMTIPRKVSNQRELGHIKDLYCYNCKDVKKFIELKSSNNEFVIAKVFNKINKKEREENLVK